MKDPKERSSTSDFCILGNSEEYRLSRFERLTLVGGEELEKALVWLSRQLAGFAYADKLGPVDIPLLLAAGQHYRKKYKVGQQHKYFKLPKEPPTVTLHPVHGLKDGRILDLVFPSCYTVQHPAYKEEYSELIANQYVHARMWKHHEKSPATVIAIHGWTMGDQRINSLAFQPGFFYQLGLDIVLVELPYHGRRSPDRDKH
ncbi:MAG: hypothetical protein KDD62_15515, partial [Bdellovibrionales bacterium]|nr:hypothetical protein [Bdellovibrionales bacterium]